MPGIVCTNLVVAPGQRISVKGDVAPTPKGFSINIGKGPENIMLHLNPRFDAHGDQRTIVCNSKINGQWGKEQRETNFPFQEGGSAEVFITHDKNEVTITLPGNHQFKFPNSSGLEGIEYICVDGDFTVKAISFA